MPTLTRITDPANGQDLPGDTLARLRHMYAELEAASILPHGTADQAISSFCNAPGYASLRPVFSDTPKARVRPGDVIVGRTCGTRRIVITPETHDALDPDFPVDAGCIAFTHPSAIAGVSWGDPRAYATFDGLEIDPEHPYAED